MEHNEEYTCLSFNTYSSNKLWQIAVNSTAADGGGVDDDDFEFSPVRKDSAFPAEEFGSFFPVFNKAKIEAPLGKLLFGDRGSCSSSESDSGDLENIPAGSYCVWRPRSDGQNSPNRCKKSRSTGSHVSKKWKFSDLLKRSNSEGKGNFVFLTPKSKATVKAPEKRKGTGGKVSPHEAFYVRNRTIKEGEKKKSYLPYRRELVGFFVKGNVFSKCSLRF